MTFANMKNNSSDRFGQMKIRYFISSTLSTPRQSVLYDPSRNQISFPRTGLIDTLIQESDTCSIPAFQFTFSR